LGGVGSTSTSTVAAHTPTVPVPVGSFQLRDSHRVKASQKRADLYNRGHARRCAGAVSIHPITYPPIRVFVWRDIRCQWASDEQRLALRGRACAGVMRGVWIGVWFDRRMCGLDGGGSATRRKSGGGKETAISYRVGRRTHTLRCLVAGRIAKARRDQPHNPHEPLVESSITHHAGADGL
jgi:hypothetical protein